MDNITQNNNPHLGGRAEENDNLEKESLSDIKKKLETGEDIKSDNLKEIQARNLAQTRDALNNGRSDTIINVEQGKGVININTGSVGNSESKKNIPADFFLKQKGFSSSNIQHKGGRL